MCFKSVNSEMEVVYYSGCGWTLLRLYNASRGWALMDSTLIVDMFVESRGGGCLDAAARSGC